MKNISLSLNAILIVAVAILYYLHFSDNSISKSNQGVDIENEIEEKEELEPDNQLVTNSKIGYINVDSLQIKYRLYEELKNKLQTKQTRYEKELDTKSKAFQRKVEEFRQKAPTMSQFEGELKQKELAQEEQALYQLEEQYSTRFQEELIKLNNELYKSIKDYIREHNKDGNYDIIIGESQTRNFVLDFNEKLDITNSVVEGLNKKYIEENQN